MAWTERQQALLQALGLRVWAPADAAAPPGPADTTSPAGPQAAIVIVSVEVSKASRRGGA